MNKKSFYSNELLVFFKKMGQLRPLFKHTLHILQQIGMIQYTVQGFELMSFGT